MTAAIWCVINLYWASACPVYTFSGILCVPFSVNVYNVYYSIFERSYICVPYTSRLSGEKSDAKKNTAGRSRQDELLHAADIMGPGSPAGASADQQASSASQQDIASIAAAPELSVDMQKFITFAGNHLLLFVAAHS